MSDPLDLAERLADAQTRLARAREILVQARKEHSSILKEVRYWRRAVKAESMRTKRAATQNENNRRLRSYAEKPSVVVTAATGEHSCPDSRGAANPLNKTKLIRDFLSQHPEGVTSREILTRLRDHVSRPCIYQALARMRHKRQVRKEQDKYYSTESACADL